MGLRISPFLTCVVTLALCLGFSCTSSQTETALQLLRMPHPFSNRNFAHFGFNVLLPSPGGNNHGSRSTLCANCSTFCKVDGGAFAGCDGGKASYRRLADGAHSFEVCTNGTTPPTCTTYNWTVDTVSPTATITAGAPFTSSDRVSVNISFSEPCAGFGCLSVNACNILVYGPGEVLPETLNIVEPNLTYSIAVRMSERSHYGRLILVMDRNFCADPAGNHFTRTRNSSLIIHFDRRSVVANLRTHVPEQLLQINGETRTVMATNKNKNLKVYLYFSGPIVNSSDEVLHSLNTNQGFLIPINGSTFGQRRFGYQLENVSELAVVSLSLQSNLVITRQGTSVSPASPITFLFDSHRPEVKLSPIGNTRMKEKSIVILIKFTKPVFGFNSSHLSIEGGHLQSFQKMSWGNYAAHVQANTGVMSISIPENITTDVSGNRNQASNTLQVMRYSVPVESLIISSFATAVFVVTAIVSGLLTLSTASLLSVGAFSRPNSVLCSEPARNLFRIASHIQVFALSKWVAVALPIEYYELARGLQWSIPYFNLPWERPDAHSLIVGSDSPPDDRLSRIPKTRNSIVFQALQPLGSSASAPKVYGLPLTPMEYASYFESQIMKPEAEHILDPQNSHGWRDFSRIMFWLAVIAGSLVLLHVLLLAILKFRKKTRDKQSYGALIFPRFEIFLLILALPCLCEASAALIEGGTSSGMIVGILILSLVAFILLCLLLFLSFGITFGKLLQYKEVHRVGQQFHWYQELVRVTLGPGKRGQWTWKNEPYSVYLTMFGSLFEDLRGPPKYMLSQITGSGSRKPGDRIIASDDETEDAEAPCIQKLFGILRIYYTLIELVKRVALGIIAGAYAKNWTSTRPTHAVLGITAFQLFFMVLKKPFIKKRVQLVEIVSVLCELVIFTFCAVILQRKFSVEGERKLGIAMLSVFLLAFSIEMANEWHALYRQIKHLDPVTSSFFCGLETSFIGFAVLICPHSLVKKFECRFPVNSVGETDTTSVNRSSGSRSSSDKPWLKQIREMARSSFSREGRRSAQGDSSSAKSRWNEIWKSKRSGSSSTASTSTDLKSKPKGLYKELEDIFAAK